MHHEPIFQGLARPDEGLPPPIVSLTTIHDRIREMLAWIDPQLSVSLGFVDRFVTIHDQERNRIEGELRDTFNMP